MKEKQQIPQRPYLLRALVEWVEDNGWTPMVVVNAAVADVQVPLAFVEDGRITLNISASAMSQREMGNEVVTGSARFSGRSEYLYLPLESIEALIVRETNAVTVFADESDDAVAQALSDELETVTEPTPKRPSLSAVSSRQESELAESDTDGGDDEPPRPPRGKPQLKLVK